MDDAREILLGRLAVKQGLISQEELDCCLRAQTTSPPGTTLGAMLSELGLISQAQLDQLVALQQQALASPSPYSQKPYSQDLLGRHAVEAGLLTQQQLHQCLLQQSAPGGPPKRLGEVLVEKGFLSAEQVRQLLAKQGKRLLRCAKCGGQFNVANAPQGAALVCPRCKGPLAEATGLEGVGAGGTIHPPLKPGAQGPNPSSRAPNPAWRVANPAPRVPRSAAAPPKAPAPAPLPVAQPVPPPPAAKPSEEMTLQLLPATKAAPTFAAPPPELEEPAEVQPTRRRWPVVAMACGVLVLSGLLVFMTQRKHPAAPQSSTQAAGLPATPDPAPPPDPKRVEADELETFLQTHSSEPKECVRRLREALDHLAGTEYETRILAALAEQQKAVSEQAGAALQERRRAASDLVSKRRYGEALAALADFGKEDDPLGRWNTLLIQERQRVSDAAHSDWAAIASNALECARQGDIEGALKQAAQGRDFGIPDIASAADRLCEQIRSTTKAPPPTPQPPVEKPPEPELPPPTVTLDALLAALAGGKYPDWMVESLPCPLCGEMNPRRLPCLTCQGQGKLTCPMCKGKGTVACPNALHQNGADKNTKAGDWKHFCKLCNNACELPCPMCSGKKLLPCPDCKGDRVVDWECPLSEKRTSVPIPKGGKGCWLCKGAVPVTCRACGGTGRAKGGPCATCGGERKVPCKDCGGFTRAVCKGCGGTGYVETKAVPAYDPNTGKVIQGGMSKTSCERCKGRGWTECAACKGGFLACEACSGKDSKGGECWACGGKGKWDACPVCGEGAVWWTQTPEGAAVFLCRLGDLVPFADAGMALVEGKAEGTWYALIVDDHSGKGEVGWASDLGALGFVSSDDLLNGRGLGKAIEDRGSRVGLVSDALRGAVVPAGKAAVFVLNEKSGSARSGDSVTLSREGKPFLKLVRAPLDVTLREFLASRYWKKALMKR